LPDSVELGSHDEDRVGYRVVGKPRNIFHRCKTRQPRARGKLPESSGKKWT